MERRGGLAGEAGFTLIEVLVAVVVMAIVGTAVAAISLTGVVQISDDTQERQLDATTAQWVSMVFARDVQGASEIAGECAPDGTTKRLVTLGASDASGDVEYRTTLVAPFTLIRLDCGEAPRTIVEGLASEPSVACDPGCATGDRPKVVTLEVDRTARFGFELDGAPRVTDGNETGVPGDLPDFLSLGGDDPLTVSGNSVLTVVGNAYINLPDGEDSGVIVTLNGSGGPDLADKHLIVTGDFALQGDGECPNCSTHANKVPFKFAEQIPDPLRFLPPPTSLPDIRTDCPVVGDVRVCEPGIYDVAFPPAGGGDGGVKDFELEPGVYVLRAGMKMTNGSISGNEILLYNETGDVSITGADLDLEPQSSGMYRGVLLFQARNNTAGLKVVGNGSLASLVGTIYVPASTGVVLGGGSGQLRVGRVVGASLEVSGGGEVVVDGSS